jgi:hypothetical protein
MWSFQWHFESNFASHNDLVLDHNRNLESKLQPLTREIVECQVRYNRTEQGCQMGYFQTKNGTLGTFWRV